MKKILLFFVYMMVVLWSRENNSVAQTVSSATKPIASTWPVTEPMIAVNPTDPNNFIAVYSNWHDASTRYSGSSRTTDGGVTWSGTEVPFRKYFDQADPCITFDANGNAYYSYLDTQAPAGQKRSAIVVARSTNKGSSWADTNIVVDFDAGYVSDKPWITADITLTCPHIMCQCVI